MASVTLSLVSHTNAGKTTLARTLLGREIGEVRDAPHVTEFAESHTLIASPEGDELRLWDTPGFGDSARLVRRLRQSGQPLGWFLSQVWDRWRDRPFWATQQALRHVQAESDVVLYLVNAAESPAAAGYVASEMELLAWLGKPVLVLLNQLGAPREPALEEADIDAWRRHLETWPLVREVLPLDAFARCWVHEHTLLGAVEGVLAASTTGLTTKATSGTTMDGITDDTSDAPASEKSVAMQRLAAAWLVGREATFDASMQVLAEGLAASAAAREALPEGAGGLRERLRQLGEAIGRRLDNDRPEGSDDAKAPAAAAQARLAKALDAEVRAATARLLALHGIEGRAESEILHRVAHQFALRVKVPEGRSALVGGAVTGALVGLKADVLSGGLTLGGGLLAGGLLGALGAAGVARGINVVRDTGSAWVGFGDEAMAALVQAALLRYLAVAHFGRGRGEWVQGEAPPHWPQAVADALLPNAAAWAALWAGRSRRYDNPGEAAALVAMLQPLMHQAARNVLRRLYPGTLPAAAG